MTSNPEPRTETVCERKQDVGSQEGCPQGQSRGPLGLRFYRFFFVSFFGLLLVEGAAALGFFATSALLGSHCSASSLVRGLTREQHLPCTSISRTFKSGGAAPHLKQVRGKKDR